MLEHLEARYYFYRSRRFISIRNSIRLILVHYIQSDPVTVRVRVDELCGCAVLKCNLLSA